MARVSGYLVIIGWWIDFVSPSDPHCIIEVAEVGCPSLFKTAFSTTSLGCYSRPYLVFFFSRIFTLQWTLHSRDPRRMFLQCGQSTLLLSPLHTNLCLLGCIHNLFSWFSGYLTHILNFPFHLTSSSQYSCFSQTRVLTFTVYTMYFSLTPFVHNTSVQRA